MFQPKTSMNDTELAPPPSEVALTNAQKRALNILGSRMLSRGSIEKRLRELGETEENASGAAAWLARIGLIDDEEFARELVRSFARRGYGVNRIRAELQKRLVPRELWDSALAETEPGDSAASAETYIASKLRGAAPDRDDRRRVSAALARRGFTWDDINAAWAAYGENLGEGS
ncbi:MAG: recombination regulator RecX [Oscillospiraceae bacterium]|jgi:regulatory protein|nr:recombination regulator RecX [Oscillospiraceae bacterium]